MKKFQLILNPIRDWNIKFEGGVIIQQLFQLILNPIRDWNIFFAVRLESDKSVPINLKPY